MKHALLLLILACVLTSCSCGRSEQDANQITDSAAMVTLEQARQQAIAAAGAIAVSDTTDTLAMQRAIIDAFATRSQMKLNGDEKAAAEFDKALEEELQRLAPDLTAQVFAADRQSRAD